MHFTLYTLSAFIVETLNTILILHTKILEEQPLTEDGKVEASVVFQSG